MANVYAGVGFAEIAGSTAYPSGMFGHFAAGITCVSCHMGTYTAGTGGHTWWPNVDNCTSCHSSATDFDIGGVQSDTQVLLDTLRDLLLDQGVIEYVVEDEAYEPIVGTYTMEQAQAFFNWIGLSEDRSLGVHNPPVRGSPADELDRGDHPRPVGRYQVERTERPERKLRPFS